MSNTWKKVLFRNIFPKLMKLFYISNIGCLLFVDVIHVTNQKQSHFSKTQRRLAAFTFCLSLLVFVTFILIYLDSHLFVY